MTNTIRESWRLEQRRFAFAERDNGRCIRDGQVIPIACNHSPAPRFFDTVWHEERGKGAEKHCKTHALVLVYSLALMPSLTKEQKLRLLTILLESRHGDLREQNLNRQGKGHFHVSGMGHEAMAAISVQMQANDYIVPYYRDRALVLGRGVSSRQLASDYFAKAKSESHGRQMPSHYSCAEKLLRSDLLCQGTEIAGALCG